MAKKALKKLADKEEPIMTHLEKEEQEAKEISQKIFSYVNSMGHNKELLAKAFTQQHNTIQQCIFGSIILAIQKWAEMYDKGWYDLRNEATCKACKKIVETLGKDVYLPFV